MEISAERGKKTKINLVAAAMYLLYAGAAVALFVFREYWMSAVQIFHISTELLCMAVTLVMYTLHLGKKEENEKREEYFAMLCVLIYMAMFTDMISWAVDGAAEYALINAVARGLVSVMIFAHGFVFFEYIFSYLDEISGSVKKLKTTIEIIAVLAFVLRLVMIAVGQYFTIDADGRYQPGPGFMWSFVFIILLVFFACGIAAGAGLMLRRMLAFLSYPFAMVCMMGIGYIDGDYVDMLMAIDLSVILLYCSSFIDMERNKSSLDESIQTYLSGDITTGMEGAEDPQPGGTLTNATMLFCSIHHFGEAMETMEPEDAVIVLNHFYSSMTDIIEEHGGNLLEYPGYGIFCIFEGSDGADNHAVAAVKTAYRMQQQMGQINEWTRKNHYPNLRFGIGINTGDIVLGNVGSQHHMRHSAIGKHVNLASRTAAFADDGEIMMTRNTLDECGDRITAVFVDTIVPKGISKPVDVYRVKVL